MNNEFVAELFRALMIITSICLMNRKGLMFTRILSSFVAFISVYIAACYPFLKLAFLCLRSRCAVFTFPVGCFLMVIMSIRHLELIPIATPSS
jgi:hypothetical protein